MLGTITATRCTLAEVAASLEPYALSHDQAARALDELGAIRRLTEGMLAKAAKRVAETASCRKGAGRDAAHAYARAAGVESSEARRAMTMAKQLERLPETAAAASEGRLSTREAAMVAEAATADPSVESELLEAAAQGIVPLKDACIASRARSEDPVERAARQRSVRRFRMWSAGDGMVEGSFRLTPEIGGQIKAGDRRRGPTLLPSAPQERTPRVTRGLLRRRARRAHPRQTRPAEEWRDRGARRGRSRGTRARQHAAG